MTKLINLILESEIITIYLKTYPKLEYPMKRFEQSRTKAGLLPGFDYSKHGMVIVRVKEVPLTMCAVLIRKDFRHFNAAHS